MPLNWMELEVTKEEWAGMSYTRNRNRNRTTHYDGVFFFVPPHPFFSPSSFLFAPDLAIERDPAVGVGDSVRGGEGETKQRCFVS